MISALFSCVISYTARRSGLKQHCPNRQVLFASAASTMKTKVFGFDGDNDDNDGGVGKVIDVKEWMSLVLNPEKPLLDKVE